ncbi:MAG: hypothetical protein QXT47_00750 [Desulfurococcaceae archaeon]
MVKCPYYGCEGEFKTLKTWKLDFWGITPYQCPKGDGKFRYQVDLTDKYKNFTMRTIVKKNKE